jgi:hypothetical protein
MLISVLSELRYFIFFFGTVIVVFAELLAVILRNPSA